MTEQVIPENDHPETDAPAEEAELRDETDDAAEEALTPEAIIAQLEEDLATSKDQMMRLAAELDNTRRRAAKEKTEATQYGLTNFARDLLSVADNFQRALESLPAQETEISAEALAGMINGVRMTEKELLKVFERNGVNRLFPEGEAFDPNLHQAIAEVPGGDIPKGHVVNVAQPGFTIGDRVLRAAMVTVSNGE
jgi:molecular chaperone GrpE